jgi:hypothetical protein
LRPRERDVDQSDGGSFVIHIPSLLKDMYKSTYELQLVNRILISHDVAVAR